MLAVRIALLVNGMTGYLDAEFSALQDRGNDLFIATPGRPEVAVGAMRDTAFSEFRVASSAEVYLPWQSDPDPADLVARVEAFKPDAVIMWAWNFSDAYRAVMKAVPAHVVRGMVMDNLWRGAARQYLGRMIHRWYIRPVADFALVPSDRSEYYAKLLGFSPADVVRGSISADTSLFHSGPRTGDELASHRSFLYVGRLVDHKGADVLAASYRRYRELAAAAGVEPWRLQVAGIGPLEPLFTSLEGVDLLGFRQPPEVAELMRSASALVLPSHIEPYGVVVHEAAASGLPILASDFAGAMPGFVADGGNGWVVAAGDAEAMAEAMLRMARAGAERLQEMSDISRALSTRNSPQRWARHLEEELARRIAAGGGRLRP